MQGSESKTKEHPDLYKKSIKGSYWVLLTRLATEVLGLVKSIIIFNFLFNANLELIIVTNLLMAILTTTSETGFNLALVQKKDNVEDYLDTAWVFGIFRGFILFVAIYFIAPFFVSLRITPEDAGLATSVIRVMGVNFLIGSLWNIGVIRFQKELQFHKVFWLSMTGHLTDIVLSITLVLILESVWGYVIARLISAVVNTAMSYLLCPYRPKFYFAPQKARELWRFGKWLFTAKIVGYLLNEGDDWFVWFFLGGGPLKLYRYAYRFSLMPATHIAGFISEVSFPAYSKIHSDISRLREAHLKVLQSTAMISIPTAVSIFGLGPDFVRLFLVDESQGMIPIIQILAFVGLLQSLGSSFWSLYLSVGKPYWGLFSQSIRLVLLVILIYPFTVHFGVIGTALAVMLTQGLLFPVGFTFGCRIIQCSPWKLIKPLLCCSSAAAMMLLFLSVFTQYEERITVFILIVKALGAGIFYLAALFLIDSWFKLGFRGIVKDQVDMFRLNFRNVVAWTGER